MIIAERMADALSMQLHLSTASVKGKITVYMGIGGIPVTLEVIDHFDAGAGKDAALLLEGPGDLIVLLTYSEKTTNLCFVLIDRAAMTRKPKEVMRSTSFADIAIKRFNEGDAVRGMWAQGERKSAWKAV